MFKHVEALRYVQPLREGGSLPAVVDTDDGMFVVKFRGAGQGAKALIAELIVGALAQRIGLPVPRLAIVRIDDAFGRGERDQEIQDLLRRSEGANVGIEYLDGAFNYDPAAAGEFVDDDFASRVVWLDAFVTNPDRTHRNPNLLVWHRTPWLIDHGAALYAHHDWNGVNEERTRAPFSRIGEHVLLDRATRVDAMDAELASKLGGAAIEETLAAVPDELLMDAVSAADFPTAEQARARYRAFLTERLAAPRAFASDIAIAREKRRADPPRRMAARR